MNIKLTSSQAQTLLDYLNADMRQLHEKIEKLDKLGHTEKANEIKTKTYEKLKYLSEIKNKLL